MAASSSSSMASSSSSMASSSHMTEEERILSILPYNRWPTDAYNEHHQMNPSSLPALLSESMMIHYQTTFSDKLMFPPSPTRLVVDKHPSILRPRPAKMVKGEELTGDVYNNIDTNSSRLTLCKTYGGGSDVDPVLGRLIAVNAAYFCYSLEEGGGGGGGIGVLSLNRGSKPLSLIRDVDFRVTDMALFSDDVHLLASASTGGRIFVWKINEEDPEEDGHKPQIRGQIIVDVQMDGVEAGESVYPRVCWHSHIQEVLVVGFGKNVLKIDSTLFGKGKGTLSAEKHLKCHINDNLIDGILFVGKHVGDVTLLSSCEPETTVSASKDGQVKIWDGCRELATLSPYGGERVSSLTCLTSPHCPGHTILITAGPQCEEIKLWSSVAESWECTQILKFNSSAQSQIFNRVIALPGTGFLLVMNAKQSAIYVVRIMYGLDPSATRMDYMARFDVSMPILSRTNDITRDRDHVKVCCLQSQVLQVYELDISQFVTPKDTSLEHASTSRHSSGEEYEKILSELLSMQTEIHTQLADLASHNAEHHKKQLSVIKTLAFHDVEHEKRLQAAVKDLTSMVANVDHVCQGMAKFTTDYRQEIKDFLSPFLISLQEEIISLQLKTEAMSKGIAQMSCTLNQLSANAGATDHRKELLRLLSEQKYDQSFMLALESNLDSSDVLWLCAKIDLEKMCSERALSVGVLMLVLDHLASSITSSNDDVPGWMKIMTNAIYPTDPLVLLPVFTMLAGLLVKVERYAASPTTEQLKDIIKAKMHHIQMLATKLKIPTLDYKKFEDFRF